jgi:hypothetical protein
MGGLRKVCKLLISRLARILANDNDIELAFLVSNLRENTTKVGLRKPSRVLTCAGGDSRREASVVRHSD